jgi:chemotaxis protein CheX
VIDELRGAVVSVLSMMGVPASASAFAERKDPLHRLSGDMAVLVGIVGTKKGILSYEFDADGILSVLRVMAPGMELDPESEVAESALAELSNMVSGNFLTALGSQGLDITPPTLVRGRGLLGVANTAPAVRVLFPLPGGNLSVSLSLV